MLAMVLSSHPGDYVARTTCPRGDVDVESCWQRCHRVMLVMVLPSPTTDGAAESTLVVARCRCRGAMSLLSHAVRPESESTTGVGMYLRYKHV
jgi:hypothetical protein